MKKLSLQTLYLFICVLLFTACSKSSNDDVTTPEPPVADTMFNRLITVLNFGEALPDGSQPLDSQAPIYYSLEQNQPAPATYKQTNRWDVSFNGTYRSFMGGNNTVTGNLGAGGPGKGGILILAKKFEEVTTIPADADFRTGSGLIGTDDSGAFGQGIGYYLYDFDGTIKGNGSYNSQHVAWVIQSGRTIVVRTARGNYAKIKMLSIYKDALDPSGWKRDAPHPYFSFQYVLAKAGSTTFDIK
jgi:hypothetical protein